MPIKLPINRKYLKASNFVRPGLILKITKDPIHFLSDRFKDKDGNPLEMYAYYFIDQNGDEKEVNSGSVGLAEAFNGADLEVGDTVCIYKEGDGFNTKYFVSKTDAITTPPKQEAPEKKEDDLSDIPF